MYMAMTYESSAMSFARGQHCYGSEELLCKMVRFSDLLNWFCHVIELFASIVSICCLCYGMARHGVGMNASWEEDFINVPETALGILCSNMESGIGQGC